MFGWGTSGALEEQRTGFWVRGGGFILDSECTSRVIKLDSKQKKQTPPEEFMQTKFCYNFGLQNSP
jgi:hypothetical protein